MATVDVVIIITVSCPWKASSGEAVLTLLPFSESPPLTPTGRLKDVFIPLDTDSLGLLVKLDQSLGVKSNLITDSGVKYDQESPKLQCGSPRLP